MSTLYTKSGCYPQIIPPIIELEDGSTRSNPTTFTAEEIESAGWSPAPEVPEYNISTHILNWDRETSTYVIEAIPQEELDRAREYEWRGIREERNLLLAECDYMIIKALEAGTTLSDEWIAYRQALRDLPSTSDTPGGIVWPTKPS